MRKIESDGECYIAFTEEEFDELQNCFEAMKQAYEELNSTNGVEA